ncbi:MAG: gliding motility protein GldL [Muribaculaceae bacterium]
MGKVKQYRRGIGAFISSEKGQRFFNFAYSIGAAIVIWGALFKILHLPGGNTLLSIGMGTEVLMFVLTAFDRPPREYKWETIFPALDKEKKTDDESKESEEEVVLETPNEPGVSGEAFDLAGQPVGTRPAQQAPVQQVATPVETPEQGVAQLTGATQQYLDTIQAIAAEMQRLRETTEALNSVSNTLLDSYRAVTENSENITRSSVGYIEQMEALNRNITGLNTIYSIQLKSISSQLDAIDSVNRGIKDIRDMYEKSAGSSVKYTEETEKMARNMQQLNAVYEKMLTAMTINMYRPMGIDPNINPGENR